MTYDVIVRNGLWFDGIDLPVFEEFGAGTAALHLRDQLERNEVLADPEYRRRFRASFDRKKLAGSAMPSWPESRS